MRVTTGLIALLVFLVGCATTELPEKTDAELPSEEPFVGATEILVEMDGDAAEIRDRAAQTLRIEGYEISQPSLDQPTIETEPRTFRSGTQGSARYFITIPENPGDPVLITGRIVEETTTDRQTFMRYQSYSVTPGGSRTSLTYQSWRSMETLANIMADGAILFDR